MSIETGKIDLDAYRAEQYAQQSESLLGALLANESQTSLELFQDFAGIGLTIGRQTEAEAQAKALEEEAEQLRNGAKRDTRDALIEAARTLEKESKGGDTNSRSILLGYISLSNVLEHYQMPARYQGSTRYMRDNYQDPKPVLAVFDKMKKRAPVLARNDDGPKSGVIIDQPHVRVKATAHRDGRLPSVDATLTLPMRAMVKGTLMLPVEIRTSVDSLTEDYIAGRAAIRAYLTKLKLTYNGEGGTNRHELETAQELAVAFTAAGIAFPADRLTAEIEKAKNYEQQRRALRARSYRRAFQPW